MRSIPIASFMLAALLGLVFLGTQVRVLLSRPHLDGALAVFEDVRRAHPMARISPARLAQAPPRVREALRSLERDRHPVPQDALLEAALSDVLRVSAAQPVNQQGYSPTAPSVQAVALSMWTHLSLPALVGNLVLLMLFGSIVERRFGRGGPPLLFVCGGLGGVLAHHVAAPALMGPLLGASGGVFALLGALMVPSRNAAHSRVGPVPAWGVALFLLVIEGLAAALELAPNMSHAAHLGGLITGFALGALVERTGLLPRAMSVTKA